MRDYELFEEFSERMPEYAGQTVRYQSFNGIDLQLEFENGMAMMFDSWSGLFRFIGYGENYTDEEFSIEFGHRLRTIMRRNGIGQETLANITGISRTMISFYLNGKSVPSFYNVDKIAKALRCSTDEFRYFWF